MRVFYRSCHGHVAVYEHVVAVRFCCDEMRNEWGILIGFGLKGHVRTTSREVNIFTLHPQCGWTAFPGITEIRYCPWCAQEIEVVRVK